MSARLMVGLRLLPLFAVACAADASSRAIDAAPGVASYDRPRGMPIGTGAAGGQLDDPDAPAAAASAQSEPPADPTDNSDLSIPAVQAVALQPSASLPCTGCVELNVDVNDINQRDEFVLPAEGARATRVVWTILVNFNSDQLAVQPFVDGKYGKYTSLHVNTFPLGTPVRVEQELGGKAAHVLGLVVGSSGAWTGNQTMSVFVDSVSIEGKNGFIRTFATSAEGLEPRTHAHNPKLVLHPEG